MSTATQTINKQLAQIDSPGTVALLKRMENKVAKEEALAESYGGIANESKNLGQEIDKALATNSAAQVSEELRARRQSGDYRSRKHALLARHFDHIAPQVGRRNLAG